MILKISILAVCFCVIAVTLRSYKPEYASMLSIAGSLVLLLFIMEYVPSVIEYIKELSQNLSIPIKVIEVLIKCLGILLVSEIACDICIDCNEKAMSTKVGLCAKILMLISALPVFNDLISVISGLIK